MDGTFEWNHFSNHSSAIDLHLKIKVVAFVSEASLHVQKNIKLSAINSFNVGSSSHCIVVADAFGLKFL